LLAEVTFANVLLKVYDPSPWTCALIWL